MRTDTSNVSVNKIKFGFALNGLSPSYIEYLMGNTRLFSLHQ